MAIKLYTAKTYPFDWDGLRVGLRLPTVAEMKEISRARDAYFATITEAAPQGDQATLGDFQFLVGSILACDPDDAKNPWFADNEAKQKELAQNGVNKNLAEEMPSSFFVAATGHFNSTITRENLSDEDRVKFDEQLAKINAGDSEAGKPESQEPPIGTPTTPTAQNSEGSSSELQSTSSAAPTVSTAGDTTVS